VKIERKGRTVTEAINDPAKSAAISAEDHEYYDFGEAFFEKKKELGYVEMINYN